MIFKQNLSKQDKQAVIVLTISFILTFLIIMASGHYSIFLTPFRLSGFEEGKVAPGDLIADHNYSYIDTEASQMKIDDELSSVFPIFEMENEKTKTIISNFTLFTQQYLLYTDTADLNLKSEIKSQYSNLYSNEEINFLLDDVDPYIVIPKASDLIEEVLLKGVIEKTDKLIYKDLSKIQLWHWERGRRNFTIVDSDNLVTLQTLGNWIDSRLLLTKMSDSEKSAVKLIVSVFVKENVFFNEVQTQLRYDEIRKEIEPVMEQIKPGDYIIKQGFVVTPKDMVKALTMNKKDKSINFIQISAGFLFLILLYTFAILMFKPLFHGKKRKYQYIYLLLAFYFVFIIYTSIIIQFNFTVNYSVSLFLPTALFSMMIVILIGFEESILSVIILSVSQLLFPGATISGFIFSFVTGTSAAFLMKGVVKRIDLVRPAVFLAIINIIVLLFGFPKIFDINWLLMVILYAAMNAFISSILNLTLIPVFEHFLNIPTVFRLMELSDMNAPLFRKMVSMAPGTYGHSMAVANLADAACRDIGANPLLARVGAYYHDIGKLDQPEYFIENQTEANKHDMLNPSLSVAVIKSHVKVGVEKAKEMGLPFEVIEIISQHHGSGLIGYFYIEAINKEGNKKNIEPGDYSYTGIPPESKEAAVVMLADTVEAASRVLKKPTISKLEKFIWKLIMEKIERGQMSNTSLTMNDMLVIKKSFVNILSGYFHTRIEYPKIKRKAV